MEIVVRPDAQVAALTVADIFESTITGHRENEGTSPVLGLATGSSPIETYQELIRRHREEGLSFEGITVFMLDEYLGLPRDHEQSYHTFIREQFTRHIDIDDADVHSPDGEATDVIAETERYEAAIAESGGVDLQILGIGTDGHIGFNEPGSSLASRTRIKTLTQQTRDDNARFFASLDEVPSHCLTQGLGTIMKAKHVVLTASGAGKAQAVAAMCEGPVTTMCPGSVLQMHPHATIVIDEPAAAGLTHRDYYDFALAHKPAWQGY